MTRRIGVVIPSYNHARFVAQAVRSVLSQTVDGVELVVVDDGSKDASVSVVRDVLAEFPGRRSVLIEQENRGAHAAIMRGVAELDTPCCAVLNSDDIYEQDRFERIMPALDAPLSIAFSGLAIINEAGEELGPHHPWTRWYAEALTAATSEPTVGFGLLVHNFSVTSGNFVFTRALFERLGGFGNQKFVHDWDFLLRATALTEPVFDPSRLMRYRVHDSNTTETVRSRLGEECSLAVRRYAELRRMEGASALSPGPEGWPSYWARFVSNRSAFWAPGHTPHPAGSMLSGSR
jgi:glycosyltransferase involved in cell wall biosynthesis